MPETVSLNNTIISDNYDLNIWDKLSYETDGAETGGWQISIYSIRSENDGYGCGEHLKDKTIVLTPTESKRLTLGWGEDLGGDYSEDDDFWIDKDGFFDTYSDIPERVANLLRALPEYEMGLDG